MSFLAWERGLKHPYAWLKAMVEKLGAKNDLKPANYYQGCICAWNVHS